MGLEQRSEAPMRFEAGCLHLWLVSPAVVQRAGEEASVGLHGEEERKRYEALATADLKRAFLGRRGVLARLLGTYCGKDPRELRLLRQSSGKPMLAPGMSGPHFSVSSSGERVLAAFCWDQPVGVDLERLRADVGRDVIVERYFNPAEKAELARCSPERQLRLFLQIWTRKEALLKLFGEGLNGLDALLQGQERFQRAWTEELSLPDSLSGTVALPRPPVSFDLRQWSEGQEPPGLAALIRAARPELVLASAEPHLPR